MDDAELRDLATKRLKARTDFYHYLLVWLAVTVLVTLVWGLTSQWNGYFWPAWVIGGMGVAALFQAIQVFGPVRGVYSDQKITDEMNKLRGGSGS